MLRFFNSSFLFVSFIFVVGLLSVACDGGAVKRSETDVLTDSLKKLTDALKTSPGFADLYFRRGQLYYKLGDSAKTFADLNKAIELDTTKPDYFHYRGYYRVFWKQNELAKADFKRAIALEPYAKGSYYELGNAATLSGDVNEALRNYSAALAIDSTQTGYYVGMAYAYRQLNQPDQAILWYKRGLVHDSSSMKLLNGLFEIYVNEREDLNQANRFNRQALRRNPKHPVGWFNQGYYNFLLNRRSPNPNSAFAQKYLQNAISDYSQAIGIDPRYANAYYHRGYSYFLLNDQTHAIEDFERVVSLKPTDARPYFQLGSIFEAFDEKENALGYYEKALKLNPSLKEAADAVAELKGSKK